MDPTKRITQDYANNIDEGVVFEICIRLPVKSIFKFRCVSKLWLSILSEHSFLTKKIQRLSPPLSVNFPNLQSSWVHFPNIQSPISISDSVPCEAASPDLTRLIREHGGFSLRFLYPENCPRYEHTYVLASSNGVLLCSQISYDLRCSYILCNPLTKTKLSVPQVPDHIFRGTLEYGFICEPSCTSSSSSILTPTVYEIVRVPWMLKYTSQTAKFNIDIISSDLGHWNTYEAAVPAYVGWCSDGNIVIHNGVAYWIIDDNRIIAYHLNNKCGTQQCRLINLPDANSIRIRSYGYLGVSEGFLVYIPNKQRELIVWILDKCSSLCDWSSVSYQAFSFLITAGLPSWFQRDHVFKTVAINPKDRAELILECYKTGFLSSYYQGLVYFNIKTKLIRSVGYSTERVSGALLITPWPTTLH